MTKPRTRKSGNAIIEFTLVGIPLIFILLATFEMARGMWLYATVAHAVRQGARYAAVHGKDCSTPPNQCAITIGDIALVIRDAGVGLDPADFWVAVITVAPKAVPAVTFTTLATLLTDASTFGAANSGVAGNDVIVTGVYHFRTALMAFFSGPVLPPPPGPSDSESSDVGVIRQAATSRERIEF